MYARKVQKDTECLNSYCENERFGEGVSFILRCLCSECLKRLNKELPQPITTEDIASWIKTFPPGTLGFLYESA